MFDKLKGLFAAEKTLELGIDEVLALIRSEFASELKAADEKTGMLVGETCRELLLLKEMLISLKGKQSEHIFANAVKNKFCSRSLQFLEKVEKPEAGYGDVIKFSDNIRSLTTDVSKIGFREMLHLRAFKEQMDSIAGKVKLIIELNGKLDSNTRENALLKKIDNIEAVINDVRNNKISVTALEKEVKAETACIENAGKGIAEKKMQLEEFLKNDGFLKADSLAREVEELEKQRAIVKQHISTEFSGIDKVLKRFQYSGLANREEECLINSYITDSNAFLSDNSLKIRDMLERAGQKIGSQELEIGEKKHEKLIYLLENFEALISLRNQYKEIENTISEKNRQRQEIMPIFDKKALMEKEINDAEIKLEQLKKHRESIEAGMVQRKKDIEASGNELVIMIEELLKKDVVIR